MIIIGMDLILMYLPIQRSYLMQLDHLNGLQRKDMLGTIQKLRSDLGVVFKRLERDELVERNWAKLSELPEYSERNKRTKHLVDKRPFAVLTDDELRKLLPYQRFGPTRAIEVAQRPP